MYRSHDHHFIVYGAMFLGQYTPAITAAQELIDTTPEELLRIPSPPMADFVEGYLSMKQHVLVRFGKWREIIAQELPKDPDLYCSTTAMTLYAKGVAHSVLGEIEQAERARAAFRAAKARVPESRRLHNNTMVDLLAIAEEMLTGELEYRRGNFDLAFAHLRRAVELDDSLPYDEPWGWMQPTPARARRAPAGAGPSRRGRGPSIAPTSASTARPTAPAGIQRTSGACTASTNA
jgi:tetratricopeptide (TPR) repeat protein